MRVANNGRGRRRLVGIALYPCHVDPPQVQPSSEAYFERVPLIEAWCGRCMRYGALDPFSRRRINSVHTAETLETESVACARLHAWN